MKIVVTPSLGKWIFAAAVALVFGLIYVAWTPYLTLFADCIKSGCFE